MPDIQNGSQTQSVDISDQKRESWAQRIGNSAYARINKNIIEVILEKDNAGAFLVSDSDCARLLTKLGLDLRPGIHIEGVQVCPDERGVIIGTLKDNGNPENFCRHDVLQVTHSGVRSVLVKQGGKKDIVMTFKGIHPNTRDSTVLSYISKFGAVPQAKVVYGIYNEGPLKGIRNGDRQYKAEIKPGINIGSYHLIDGVKVTLRYAGQQQTCGRCQKIAANCRGGGLAKKCEAQGGERVDFRNFITNLWKDIGYTPELGQDEIEEDCDHVEPTDQFTPPKVQSFPIEKFSGVRIKSSQKI